MITSLAVFAAAIALMTHVVVIRHTANRAIPQVAGNVVRVCAYCNMIMGTHPGALKSGSLMTSAGQIPSGPGLILTHGICQSCYAHQKRELDKAP